jgi:hypothetical protein
MKYVYLLQRATKFYHIIMLIVYCSSRDMDALEQIYLQGEKRIFSACEFSCSLSAMGVTCPWAEAWAFTLGSTV